LRILVTGATGFIGRHVARALEASGHEVIGLVRRAPSSHGRHINGDFSVDFDTVVWRQRLAGIDAVVNAVGILRQSRAQSFNALHIMAPKALFSACADAGVRKVIQISALGADADAISRYHMSKAVADRHLMTLPLAWSILQPSLVFGPGGASARLFITLASMPIVCLPGAGEQRVQPVHIDDLTELCVRLVQNGDYDGHIVPVVGPRPYSVRELLRELRDGMGLGAPLFVEVPSRIVRLVATLANRIPGVPFDTETLQMLERGNAASPAALATALGRAPRVPLPVADGLGGPGPLADWARLNWLLPLLRLSIALVWIVTGVLSLGIYPVAESYLLLARVGLTGGMAALALYGAAGLDLLMGMGILLLRRRTWLWRAQIVLIAGYSVIIAFALPEFWLHPFGPLLKNIPLLALLVALHELECRH
jgi:nucleoside-diphosphate-sugar epimerase